MHNARRVRGRQRFQHAQHQRDSVARRQRAALAQQLGERATRHQFVDEVRLLIVLIGLEQRHDMGVGQAAHAARFLQPLTHQRAVGVGGAVQHLDRHLAFKPGVETEPHRGLGAFSEDADQREAAEGLRWSRSCLGHVGSQAGVRIGGLTCTETGGAGAADSASRGPATPPWRMVSRAL